MVQIYRRNRSHPVAWNGLCSNCRMESFIRFTGISGSLRKDSFNTKLLHHAATLLPEGAAFNIISIETAAGPIRKNYRS